MASEIKALEGSADGAYRVLFLYPIAAPKQVAGANVVPTPAPTEGMIANLLDATEVAALNGGTMAYEILDYRPDPALSGPDLLAKLREIYASKKAVFDTDYEARYRYVGGEWDATV